MMDRRILPHFAAVAIGVMSPLARADETTSSAITAELMQGLPLRSVGPAVTPGRLADIAVDARNDSIWYVAAASSGLWKTTNRGLTWKPIFDQYGSFSLGCISIDPKDSNTLYLGTGENQSQRSVSFGDGLYKSTDAGQSWKKIGLANSEHIARVLFDPRDSHTLFVACQGPLWSPGGDRGLYKSTDAGATWKPVLQISDNTGVTDVALDPRNPDVMYAAAYQRRRNVGVLVGGGPEGALYKSTDGGEHWRKLAKGLPTADVGRIGLAISPQRPDVVYAYITAAERQQGFYQSEDQGETWSRQSDLNSVDPQYYGKVFADPHKFDHLWVMDVNVHETADGGKTFHNAFTGIHVDNHTLWLDPKDPRHMLEGNDGGLYETWDTAQSWRHFTNLPTTQFYHVALDNALPFYNIAGGAQDNGSSAGPSSTVNRVGIRPGDWITIGGSDGMQPRIDPEDPTIVYSMAQNGSIQRLDKRTSISKDIQPRDRSAGPLRWNWDAPFLISSHSHTRLYLAANRLFRSDDRGDHWTPISPDVTRHIDRDQVEVMGKLWDKDAVSRNLWTTDLSVCTTMAESTHDEGTLALGTDDGLIQITQDGGKNWQKLESFPGVPAGTFVSCLAMSRYDAGVLFASFNNYQRGDFKSYLLRSTDLGKTWTSIAGDLPDRHPVWCIVEDPVNRSLLFAGTEFGLYFTLDAGRHWTQLRGNAPTIAFRDLQIQQRESDLVGASFGRGFFVLDDLTPLRELTDATLTKDAVVFPMRRARQYNELTYVRAAPEDYLGPNAPHGAIITYYIGKDMGGGRETGGERQAESQPGTARERDQAPARTGVVVTITDGAGTTMRRLDVPATPGLHRITWDLRGGTPVASAPGAEQGEEFDPAPEEEEEEMDSPEGEMTPPAATERAETRAAAERGAESQPAENETAQAAPPGRGRGRGRGGAPQLPAVKPGTYRVTLGRLEGGNFEPIAPPQTLEVVPLQDGQK
jgi:photosystem II stability/assembly factor-like uncharacterized protein